MNEERPKNYYSLNLTEGRIFIIFISILIIITVVVFSIALIISNSNNRNSNKNSILEKEELKVSENENYSYYDSNESSKEDSFLVEKNESSSQGKTTIIDATSDSNNKDFQVQINEKEKTDSEIVKLDNNDVLYSSKYSNKNETNNVQNNTQEVIKKQNSTTIKESSNSKKREIRYTVQIGSYLDKKTAEEISLFYKIQGYPAYIIEKTTGDKKFYRLRVGPFKQREDAEKYLTTLKDSKYGKESSIWVVYL